MVGFLWGLIESICSYTLNSRTVIKIRLLFFVVFNSNEWERFSLLIVLICVIVKFILFHLSCGKL